jgi:predicted MPP superfamily phosphohydrolase
MIDNPMLALRENSSANGHAVHDLIERLGETHFRQRMTIEQNHADDVFGRGRTRFHIQNAEWILDLLDAGLNLSGLQARGLANILDIRTVHEEWHIPALPAAFSGYRILQISDLHIDIAPGLTEAVIAAIAPLEYDLCVITGDYRWQTSGPDRAAQREMRRLIPHIRGPRYAILGNHDFISFVPPMEAAGLPFLLNETVALRRGHAAIYLSGVDDPHFYETHNLQKAGDAIPNGSIGILLAHTPEIYRQAAAAGYDLVLSGHTHGGQVCLPGRRAVINNANCPREMVYGRWQFHNTQGYTAAGTGSSGVPVRFNCAPEVTVHTLLPVD